MTTLACAPAAPARPRSAGLAGTWLSLRLVLRRDRIVLPLWTFVLGVLMPVTYAGSIRTVYRTPADLQAFATATSANRAEIALYGPVFNASLGAVSIWKAQALGAVLAVAVILTVIRHTRAEEEVGRTELVDSASVGRFAGLTAAVLMSAGASIVVGAAFALMLCAYRLPVSGSIAYGAGLTAAGLVFTGVGAVAAQVSPSARAARGYALAALGVAFAVRAVGDAGSGTLSWLSPLGWTVLIRPFAQERWWPLGLHAVAIVALLAAAYGLLARRDVGSGLLAERAGSAGAGRGLSGPFGLAWRMQRGVMLAWTVALTLYGLLFGSAATSVGKQLGSNEAFQQFLQRIGGTRQLDDMFVGIAISMLAMAAAAYAVSAVLRLHSEEIAERAEAVLTGAVGRTRWAASHIVYALLGPSLAVLAAGTAAGLAYGNSTHDLGGKLAACVAGAAVQLPAIWLTAAVAVAFFGLSPRRATSVWAVYVGFLLIYMFGGVARFPQWARDLEPYSHLPKLPGGHFNAVPLLWEVLVTAVLLVIGLVALRRRDLR
ncbi:ABC transporter permease [Nocardia sp. alder85J]|uniref:ABC transporter permease n=1 Tax=Nocardia sp. alder85J TaxID=2862949 RepID=UPI001CD42CE4|nr:ABC transporter permease [Nocardia sp. alder85J]MCX4092491.1 ABC transporter permease [Nocardia sp. alder85J]